jgi:urea transporter
MSIGPRDIGFVAAIALGVGLVAGTVLGTTIDREVIVKDCQTERFRAGGEGFDCLAMEKRK